MSIVRDVDQSAIRHRLAHDLRASLFNIDGFVEEINASLSTLERLMQRDDLPEDFRQLAGQLLNDDLKPCFGCVEAAAKQLSERIDLLSATSEALFVEGHEDTP